MRGPWKVVVEEPVEGSQTWSATIIDERIEEATNAEALSRQEAIQKVQDQWARALHEDFGPQDFVVEGS